MILRTLFAAGALALAASSATAFTYQDGGGSASSADRKFDIEEQSRQFRSGGLDLSTPGKRDIETPWGKGTMTFGTQNGARGFGTSSAGRQHMDRMLTAPGLQYRYD